MAEEVSESAQRDGRGSRENETRLSLLDVLIATPSLTARGHEELSRVR